MPHTHPSTPVWVKVLLIAVVAGSAVWWLADRHDRTGNQDRLGAIASQIAGREVRVRCPGPFWRVVGYDMVEGKVQVGADGRPADETRLSETSCAELDALAEGRRAKELACIGRTAIACGPRGREVAIAVDVLAHESFHLRGILDEAETECRSLQAMARTAQRLGATAEQGRAMATAQYTGTYEQMPEAYRTGDCVDGGALDQRPDDPRFP
ncbi:MAG: hypothetical protein ABW081_13705 [Solirubrobacteraceae bacterium]